MRANDQGKVERQACRVGRMHLRGAGLLLLAVIGTGGISAHAQPLQGGVSQDVFSRGSSGRGTYSTGSQSRQPNDGPCNNPYGCGRGTGIPGGIGALFGGTGSGPNPPGRDVYCQQSPGQPMYGPYRGTGTNTPCGPAFQRGQPQPQSQGSPALIALSDFLNSMAPHYDMTRPHEGLRVVQDSLTNLGFGWLTGRAAYALKALAAKALAARAGGQAVQLARAAAQPLAGWLPRVGSAVGAQIPLGLESTSLPAGIVVPNILRTTPRPIFLQEKAFSCALACVKMVMQTVTRRTYPESWLRRLVNSTAGNRNIYAPRFGSILEHLADLLRVAGVRATYATGQDLAALAKATEGGYPAIVQVGDATSGHAIVVDAVVGPANNQFVLIRDPWNLSVLDPTTRQFFQQMGYTSSPVIAAANFLKVFSGHVIYTGP